MSGCRWRSWELPAERREARIKRTLELVNLSGFEKKYPWQLSGGMQQRASIARALAFDADLLLMDEPFGALDEIVRDHLNEQLLKLWARTNKTICFVTHSIPEAVYLSTDRGDVAAPGPGHRRHRIDAAEGAAARHPRDAGIPGHRRTASARA
jgi:NitT/TauT family transport system ATP-binding protein